MIKCIKKNEEIKNSFFNKKKARYEPCYETCELCYQSGDIKNNKCKTCIYGFTKKEENPNNCVMICEYYYYYNDYGQHKCTQFYICPKKNEIN